MNFLMVALGGALGATCRYGLTFIPCKWDFPLATFLANFLGCFIIGLIAGLVSRQSDINQNLVLFLKTGFCGGFTTFSTFSLENITLIQNQKYCLATVYILISLCLCLLGTFCGTLLTKAK